MTERLDLFKHLFKGRNDVYGLENPATKKGKCIKEPLTDELLIEHFKGAKRVGQYPLIEGTKVSYAAIDIDDGDLEKVKAFYNRSLHYGLSSYIEKSRRKGWHLWIFFKEPVPAQKVRRIIYLILDDVGFHCEVFPKQARLTTDHPFGNFIFLPLFNWNINLQNGGANCFLDSKDDFKPYSNQWEFLNQIKLISEEYLDELIEINGLQEENPVQGNAQINKKEPVFRGLVPCHARILKEGVPKNFRDHATFRLAIQFKRRGLPKEQTQLILSDWNKKNRPPFPENEMLAVISDVYKKEYSGFGCENLEEFCEPNCPILGKENNSSTRPPSTDDETRKQKSIAHQILSLIENEKIKLLHDQHNEPHIVLPESVGYATFLRSKIFKQWLARFAWQKKNQPLSGEALQTIAQILEGKARFEGPCNELHVRVAPYDSGVVYDLGNGQVVHITPEKWSIETETPVLFRRLSHQKPQISPDKDGDLNRLLEFVNLPANEKDKERGLLLLVWLVVSFIPGFPHPPLVVHGPQGSAKSTLFGMLKELIDPSSLRILAPTDNQREFVIQAANHWFLPLDNLSYLPSWLSDAICRACTGDGFSKRQLFTDIDDVILSFQRIIGINGISLVVDKPDLLDRSLLLCLDRISKEKRQEEKKLWKRFHEYKPKILGGIFSAVSKTLSIYPRVELSTLPRMADFARWGAAAAEALGRSQETFLSAYFRAISHQHYEAIEASLVAQAIVRFMEDRENWSGTPSDLLENLNKEAERLQIDTRSKGWPKNSNWLWKKLAEAKTNLEAIGLSFERGEGSKRSITIRKSLKNAVDADGAEGDEGFKPSAPQHPQQNSHIQGEKLDEEREAIMTEHMDDVQFYRGK